jgi:hypothetical protein
LRLVPLRLETGDDLKATFFSLQRHQEKISGRRERSKLATLRFTYYLRVVRL